MQDPYEQQLHQETKDYLRKMDGEREAKPAIARLSAVWHRMQMVAKGEPARIQHVDDDKWQNVYRSKSQRIAQYVREHEPVPVPVKAGFGIAALVALLGGLLIRRNWRKRSK